MLIPNLRKPEYINIVLDGHLDHLAEEFAEAHDGRSYTAWRRTHVSLNLGRIPSRILRDQDFVDNVLEVCAVQCQAKDPERVLPTKKRHKIGKHLIAPRKPCANRILE